MSDTPKYWVENNSAEYHIIELMEADKHHPVLRLIDGGNSIRIEEACDDYYAIELSREDAIAALQEAIDWLKIIPPKEQ